MNWRVGYVPVKMHHGVPTHIIQQALFQYMLQYVSSIWRVKPWIVFQILNDYIICFYWWPSLFKILLLYFNAYARPCFGNSMSSCNLFNFFIIQSTGVSTCQFPTFAYTRIGMYQNINFIIIIIDIQPIISYVFIKYQKGHDYQQPTFPNHAFVSQNLPNARQSRNCSEHAFYTLFSGLLEWW